MIECLHNALDNFSLVTYICTAAQIHTKTTQTVIITGFVVTKKKRTVFKRFSQLKWPNI